MSENKIKELDDYIINENIEILTAGLTVYIQLKRIYKDKFGSNEILPVVQSYKGSYFRCDNDFIESYLLLTVRCFKDEDSRDDYIEDYYTYRLKFRLDSGIKDFKILSLEKGNTVREFDKKDSFTKNLLPYLYDEFKDDLAESFLNLFCPDALSTPFPLPVDSIVKALNLTRINCSLPGKSKGMILFKNKVLPFLKENEELKTGTILISNRFDPIEDIGQINNTIIHECVHWWLHKNFMELRMLKNSNDDFILCPTEDELSGIEDDEIKIIETQARALAPLILMPKQSSIAKFNELIFKYRMYGTDGRSTFEAALSEFADYFGVSEQSARIRLLKLGYNETLKDIPEIAARDKKIARFLDYWQFCEIDGNSIISKLLNKKILVYADGFVVPNLELLVKCDEEFQRYELTKYATAHILEFAVPFTIRWNEDKRVTSDVLMHSVEYSLLSTPSPTREIRVSEDAIKTLLGIFKNSNQSDPKVRDFFRTFRDFDSVTNGSMKYSTYLITLMTEHNVSIRELESRADVSKATIDKYRRVQEVPYAEDVTLKLCAGMRAYPYETLNLLRLRGTVLEPPVTDRQKLYLTLVTEYYDKGLSAWKNYIKDKDPKAL